MRKSDCVHLFEKYLCEVSNGRGYREHENPAVRFSENAKAGKYDELSDECYDTLFQETKEISAFWLNMPRQRAFDILRFALENIDIDKKSLQKMAEILAKCYAASVNPFTSEELIHKLEAEENDFDYEKYFSDIMVPEEIALISQENRNRESWGGSSYQENYSKESESADGDVPPSWRKPSLRKAILDSPPEIYRWLSKHIYGQEQAVKAAAMLLYNHAQGRKRNILFIGQTGSGKTEIWRVCKEIYPRIRIIDSTMITEEGWKGDFKVSNIFDGMNPHEAERSIIVFDEFDKLCEPRIGSSNTNYSLTIQNELLKLIEGTTVSLKNDKIDTTKISFVFCGSFERLTEMKTESEAEQSIGFGAKPGKKEAHHIYEDVLKSSDLVKYAGMRQEIAGRINQIVQLTPMTAGAYREILKDECMSPLHQLEWQYGIKLCLDENTEEKLVQEAEETHMGVRYLHSRIQQMLDEQMFQDCSRKEYMLSA